MITVKQLIDELFDPVFAFLGVSVRAVGALAMGYVAGRVVRFTLAYKIKMRFFVPLIFLSTAFLFGSLVFGQWGSPGAVGMFGLGVFAGYMFVKELEGESDEEPITVEEMALDDLDEDHAE